MAGDDNEKARDATTKAGGLPPRAVRALERARVAAKSDRERKAGRWLAAVPVGIAIVLLLLMMPRAAPPDAVPLPRVDERALTAMARLDDARAMTAGAERLPTDVLAVGSAVRAFNAAEGRAGDEVEMIDARRRLDAALRDLGRRDGLEDDLLSLRSVQTRRFLDALAAWEATGQSSTDFDELVSAFVRRASAAGWILPNRKVILSEMQRRAAFKTVWNVLIGVDAKPAFALALDEQRVLYVLYIKHPHPPDGSRGGLDAQRRAATTPEACARVNAEERRQAELWRAEKVRKLGAIDPTYPAAYALGVAYYRAGRYDLSAEAFSAFVGAHPDGPYALRAKNHLKAALSAGGTL